MADAANPRGRFCVIAGADVAGQRADRFLADAIGGVSRSRIKSLMLEGHARRDGSPLSDPAEPVRSGACYTVEVPAPVPARPQPQAIPLTILYRGSRPDRARQTSRPGCPSGARATRTAPWSTPCSPIVARHSPGIGGESDGRGSCTASIRTRRASWWWPRPKRRWPALSAAFADRALDRAYLALCWGLPAPVAGEIEGAIGRDPRDRKRMAVVARGGKTALTRYRVQTRLARRRQLARVPAGDRADPPDPGPPCATGPSRRGRSAVSAPGSRRRAGDRGAG